MRAPAVLYAVIFAALVLSGCATNGISVSETTPEGYTLTVKQTTMSTWGSKTNQGAGDFAYTGTSPDGSAFDMKAGSAVVGQQAGDPSGLVLGIIQAIMPVIGKSIEQRNVTEAPLVMINPLQPEEGMRYEY